MAIDLKNPGALRMILGVMLAGAVVGLYFFTHFLPFSFPVQREKLASLKADFEKKSTDLARARQSIADLPRFEAEYEQLHQRWQMAQELLPPDQQVAGLLRKITLAGQQTGVDFELFKPSALKVEQHYTELPVEISVGGSYHQVGAFLAELANMRRIVTVSGLKLEINDKKELAYTTRATLIASAYCLNTSSPAPAAGAKKGSDHDRKNS